MKHKTNVWVCSLLLATLLLPAAARAENSISLRISSSYVTAQGFDAVSSNDALVQAEFNYARSLFDIWRGRLWVEGSYMVGGKNSELFDKQFRTGLAVHTFNVGARYSLPVYEWLVPQVRAGLGIVVGRLALNPADTGYDQVTDWSAGFNGYLLGGVELLIPRSWISTRVTIGLTIEGGITLSSGLGFDLAPDDDEDLEQIPLLQSALGSIPLSGGQFRIGAVVRF